MCSQDYEVENIYRYARKSYKNCIGVQEARDNCGFSCEDEVNFKSDNTPRSDRIEVAGCSCPDRDGDLASILHKKRPVIIKARQQLERILDDTDKFLSDSDRRCRSLYDFLFLFRDLCISQNKCTCALIILIGIAFFMGIFFGAASCGSYLGYFNSPIMTCLNNRFVTDRFTNKDDFRGIV